MVCCHSWQWRSAPYRHWGIQVSPILWLCPLGHLLTSSAKLSHITSTYISLVRTSHMPNLKAKRTAKDNQPRKMRIPVLEHSWSLPCYPSLFLQWIHNLAHGIFLMRMLWTLAGHLVGRICPATPDLKTPKQARVPPTQEATEHRPCAASCALASLSWREGSDLCLPTSPTPGAFCPPRILPNRWLFPSTPARDRGSKTVVESYCSPEKELREWEWFIKKTYKPIGQLVIKAV